MSCFLQLTYYVVTFVQTHWHKGKHKKNTYLQISSKRKIAIPAQCKTTDAYLIITNRLWNTLAQPYLSQRYLSKHV